MVLNTIRLEVRGRIVCNLGAAMRTVSIAKLAVTHQVGGLPSVKWSVGIGPRCGGSRFKLDRNGGDQHTDIVGRGQIVS
jgi:hypothetical protein